MNFLTNFKHFLSNVFGIYVDWNEKKKKKGKFHQLVLYMKFIAAFFHSKLLKPGG